MENFEKKNSFSNSFHSSMSYFDKLRISIASEKDILSWSYGQIKKSETMNYRTFKPEKDGLFCARIFGPMKDYECLCGKYNRMKYKGSKCERCEVEVTSSRVRRERMGHINLVAPVVNCIFMKKISTILDIMAKDIDSITYLKSFIVLDSGSTSIPVKTVINEDEMNDLLDQYGPNAIKLSTGADAILTMLSSMNLEEELINCTSELSKTKSEIKIKKFRKRIKIISEFIESGNSPASMVLNVLPVLPPDLRPLVVLDGGKFGTSDLNDLYRTVVNRNNRLEKLIELRAPEVIVRNEKRMLQESVDKLFDSSKSKSQADVKKKLKSLSDQIKGKQGRFRQNLLGKRVDYSGRSVITVGPELKLHECGIPKIMALELFRPFIIQKLMLNLNVSFKGAINMLETKSSEVFEVLNEVVKGHPVLLNRAPTLHRLGIQAFEPKLIEAKAIQLHPLVCKSFNADFDGDQMAVHIPLSIEAQLEAKILMMSVNNILNPADGKISVIPSQDALLGLYYMTKISDVKHVKSFSTVDSVLVAMDNDFININSKIKYFYEFKGNFEEHITTPGSVIIFNLIPNDGQIAFKEFNCTINSKNISEIISKIYDVYGQSVVVEFVDQINKFGFKYCNNSGISFGKDDIIIPGNKYDLIINAYSKIEEINSQYELGYITYLEKKSKIEDIWYDCSNQMSSEIMNILRDDKSGWNSIYMMYHSGARGSAGQIQQLGAMVGLITKTSGDIAELPILSNYKEGLNTFEYFNSTHGARKGLTDTALKTADAGYLTRRLVDVSQDCVINNYDCGTEEGIRYELKMKGDEVVRKLSEVCYGRFLSEDLMTIDGVKVLNKGELIDKNKIDIIDNENIKEIYVRSSVKCESEKGICSKCYGLNINDHKIVNVGEAVGVIAAQSIGEPSAQLTMNTFHSGGIVSKMSQDDNVVSSYDGIIKFDELKTVKDRNGNLIVTSTNGKILVINESTQEILNTYHIESGTVLHVNDGSLVKKGSNIYKVDRYSINIVSEVDGFINFVDLKPNVSYKEEIDIFTGKATKYINDWSNVDKSLNPSIVIRQNKSIESENDFVYRLFHGCMINVNSGDSIKAGDIIAKINRIDESDIRDITSGLPRVENLFEARRPKNVAIISSHEGIVRYKDLTKNKVKLVIVTEDGEEISYSIPKGKYIKVSDGIKIKKGDVIVDGSIDPHDILAIQGIDYLVDYFVTEITGVYKSQNVNINAKHIEVVIKYMLQTVNIVDNGDSEKYEKGSVEILNDVLIENKNLESKGLKNITYTRLLTGVTKSSIHTKSFMSAASFQETLKVLVDAACKGREDNLEGIKECMITGRLIPIGTGLVLKNKMNELLKVQN